MLKYIEKLQNCELTIGQIKAWLCEYENYFKFLINESNCRKWSKWLNDKNTFIFPCVCPIREQDCIFIETYYKLNGLESYLKLEPYFKQVLSEFQSISKQEASLLDWMQKHELDWDGLTNLDSVLEIKLSVEPYNTLDIHINKEEFKYCFEFKEVYSDVYYSDEYQKYINL